MPINRYFHSDMRGAPVLAGNAPGSLVALLQACLVTGFGATTATAVTVADGIATATLPSDVAFEVGAVIGISGATPAELNGDHRVTAASMTSVSWATTAPDGTASGSISIRYAPQGWLMPFADGHVAAFKPAVPQASGCYLRVDASDGRAARVRGYESMSDLHTGSGPFPTDAQQSGGGHWPCASAANATAVPWELYVSDTGLHFVAAHYVAQSTSYAGRSGWWFGDIRSRKSGDAYSCLLLCAASFNSGEGTNYRAMNSGTHAYLARSHTQIGGSTRCGRYSPLIAPQSTSGVDGAYSGQNPHGGTYPNAADNGLILSPLLVIEGEVNNATTLRGRVPGIYHVSQRIPQGTFNPRDIVIGTGEFAGKRLHASPGQAVSFSLSSRSGAVFFDLSDEWD